MTLPYDRNKGIITYALLYMRLLIIIFLCLVEIEETESYMFAESLSHFFFKQKIFLFLRFENAAQQAQIESASI